MDNNQSFLTMLVLAIGINTAQASVTVGGTRVIYDGSKRETSLTVKNDDNVANLVQSWITPADASTPPKEALIITPPLFRLNAGEKNVLRIVRSGLPMPEDRESMYWLNVKGIAATTTTLPNNSVQIAVNTRIKLIYRPASIKDKYPEEVTQQITWKKQDSTLVVNNPTDYYMNFALVRINGKEIPGANYVAPKSEANFPVASDIRGNSITWRIYNDFGMAGKEHKSNI